MKTTLPLIEMKAIAERNGWTVTGAPDGEFETMDFYEYGKVFVLIQAENGRTEIREVGMPGKVTEQAFLDAIGKRANVRKNLSDFY